MPNNPADELAANYAKAYNGRIGFGSRPALVMIDFCLGYFEPSCDLYAAPEDTLASALRVREAVRSAGAPVILTNVVYQAGGLDGGTFFKKAPPLRNFIAGNPMGAWAPGLSPRDDELVVTKQYPSAFFGTSLAATLTAIGVDTVLLSGLTTSGCIRASCIDAMSHGFRTIVIADACGDRHPGPHEANLFDMNAKYADVVSEAETIAYLEGLKE